MRQRYIRELLHPKQARKVSALSGKRPVATKSSASRFICVPDGPKVGFLFFTECASLPLNVLITEMTDYIPMPRAKLLEI